MDGISVSGTGGVGSPQQLGEVVKKQLAAQLGAAVLMQRAAGAGPSGGSMRAKPNPQLPKQTLLNKVAQATVTGGKSNTVASISPHNSGIAVRPGELLNVTGDSKQTVATVRNGRALIDFTYNASKMLGSGTDTKIYPATINGKGAALAITKDVLSGPELLKGRLVMETLEKGGGEGVAKMYGVGTVVQEKGGEKTTHLSLLMERAKPLDLKSLGPNGKKEVATKLLSHVQQMHSNRVYHGDLKVTSEIKEDGSYKSSSNVMLREDGDPCIVDLDGVFSQEMFQRVQTDPGFAGMREEIGKNLVEDYFPTGSLIPNRLADSLRGVKEDVAIASTSFQKPLEAMKRVKQGELKAKNVVHALREANFGEVADAMAGAKRANAGVVGEAKLLELMNAKVDAALNKFSGLRKEIDDKMLAVALWQILDGSVQPLWNGEGRFATLNINGMLATLNDYDAPPEVTAFIRAQFKNW